MMERCLKCDSEEVATANAGEYLCAGVSLFLVRRNILVS